MGNEQDNKCGISILWWVAGVGVIALLLIILYWVLSGGSFKNLAEAQVAATAIEEEVVSPAVVVNIAAPQCCCDTKVSVKNVKKTYRKKIVKTQKPKHSAPPVAMSLPPARPVAALPPVKQVEAKPLLDGTDTEYGKTKTVFIPNQPEPAVEEEPRETRVVRYVIMAPRTPMHYGGGYSYGTPSYVPQQQYTPSQYYMSPNIRYPEPPPYVPPPQQVIVPPGGHSGGQGGSIVPPGGYSGGNGNGSRIVPPGGYSGR